MHRVDRSHSANQPGESPRRPLMRPLEQAALAAIMGLSAAAMGLSLLVQNIRHGGMIEIDDAEPVAIDYRIDINRADWPEFALLPNIGDEMARQIVASRAAGGPFLSHDDLRRVRGIGPKTLESIRPYLLPVADLENVAGEPSPEIPPGT